MAESRVQCRICGGSNRSFSCSIRSRRSDRQSAPKGRCHDSRSKISGSPAWRTLSNDPRWSTVMTQSRRTFLKQATAAAAGVTGASLFTGRLDPRLSVNQLLDGAAPEPQEMFRLAEKALDAAKSAGARYADVRVVRGRYYHIYVL